MKINFYGLIFVIAIMIPNVIYALKCKEDFQNKNVSKTLEILEQVGRFGCIAFMILDVPGCVFGWWFDAAFEIYLVVDAALIALYCVIWAVCWKKNNMFKALALSILPSVLFGFSGIVNGSVLLIVSAVLFAPSHILISYKNIK